MNQTDTWSCHACRRVSGNPLGSAVIPIASMEEMDLLVHLLTCGNYWILRDLLATSMRVHMRCYRVEEG